MTPESQAVEAEIVEPKRISIVIVSFNRKQALRRSLEQLGGEHQVIVVDNGSQDGSSSLETDFPAARFIRLPKNFGYTKALNIGVRSAEGTYVLLLHDDAAITGAAVSKLGDCLETRQDVGAAAPLLLTASGSKAPQVREMPTPSDPDPEFRPAPDGGEITPACVSGAAIMVRNFFLRALRQIDERYGNYGPEIEICMQVRRANKKVVILSDVTAIHEASKSPMTRPDLAGDRVAGIAVFLGKHNGFMAGMIYRLKCALSALFTFRIKVLAGALSGAKIDGTS